MPLFPPVRLLFAPGEGKCLPVLLRLLRAFLRLCGPLAALGLALRFRSFHAAVQKWLRHNRFFVVSWLNVPLRMQGLSLENYKLIVL